MNPNHSIPHLSNNNLLQARFSKWISIDLLIDAAEMKQLLDICNPTFLISMQNINSENPFILEKEQFLSVYTDYIHKLKEGLIPTYNDYKKIFHFFLSANLDQIFLKPLTADKSTLLFNCPLIEVKPICLLVSKADHSIRSSPITPDGILWGLRFSFPQLMQDAHSLETHKIDFQTHYNGLLFKKIRKWVRDFTTPISFIFDAKKITLPVRLGKLCTNWIASHPQLAPKHLTIAI